MNDVAGGARPMTEEELKLHSLKQAAQAQSIVNECAQATIRKESALDKLFRESNEASYKQHKLQRAIDILTRHPEFEEFLELLRLNLL
jgi:hypothetical protein